MRLDQSTVGINVAKVLQQKNVQIDYINIIVCSQVLYCFKSQINSPLVYITLKKVKCWLIVLEDKNNATKKTNGMKKEKGKCF